MIELAIWTIYDHPSDIPSHYVARKWIMEGENPTPTSEIITGETLEDVRKSLPQNLYRMARDASDDPKIIESWI